jgi:nucleoside-diphosphate-sugar epimerase
MIVVTGAAGFIASCLVGELNAQERGDIVVVDDFSKHEKDNNLDGKEIIAKVARSDFHNWLLEFAHEVDFVFPGCHIYTYFTLSYQGHLIDIDSCLRSLYGQT